ncbi:helix-turn-helix domain-containing protein [Pseudoflavonifractor phocaeensis]|uniref:helix-turn-helix domain-containing protein n=1 Tax=Pseudoflavonifractor phocaeensis TaxID=1870988 RepID=UPI001957B5FC|nr:helix-turn-helix transcriptional regulator [Pseudoflavonifractor phocaeensis]MBM6724371.1 helix-turn-helix transcriptional regulator [Pseudoflavonifractor phocaeensis]
MFFDSLKVACAQNGTSPTSLLKKLGMSTSSVTSWKNGVVPSLKTVYQLAEALGIDPAQLLESSGETLGGDSKKAPVLTEKDKRDVAKDVARIMESLQDGGELMFDGVPMSDEARASMAAAMRIGLEEARRRNKEIYTPRKFKKE